VDGFVDVVRHMHDCHAAFLGLAVHAHDDVLEFLTRECIDRGKRFVEQQQPRARYQGTGDGDPLRHPTGQLPGILLCDIRETEVIQHRLGSRDPCASGEVGTAQREHDVADHGEPREERAVVVLEDESHLRRRTQHGPAVQKHCAFTRPDQAGEDAQERRLAAARSSDHGEKRALADVEGHVAQCRRAVAHVALTEGRDANDGRSRSRPALA
jgi:hypothetical protein